MPKLDIPAADFELNLSRGNLKAAMAAADATNPHALWMVPPSQLRVIPGFNGRIRTPSYLEHLADTKNSIKENGYYQDRPLAGYVAREEDGDVIYVTEGHTRFEAIRELIQEGQEIEKIPVVIKPNGTSMVDLTIASIKSNDGRPYTTYELALQVKRLIGYGLDEESIARRLGFKSGKKHVDDLLTLVSASVKIRDLVIADKISATMAIAAIKQHGGKAAENLKDAVDKAASQGKKKATPKHLKADKPPKVKYPKEIAAKDVLADAEDVCKDLKYGQGIPADYALKFAATLLARVGVEVFDDQPEAMEAAIKPHVDDDDDL